MIEVGERSSAVGVCASVEYGGVEFEIFSAVGVDLDVVGISFAGVVLL